eukprot:3776651-Prymnesium_polylepis.1
MGARLGFAAGGRLKCAPLSGSLWRVVRTRFPLDLLRAGAAHLHQDDRRHRPGRPQRSPAATASSCALPSCHC